MKKEISPRDDSDEPCECGCLKIYHKLVKNLFGNWYGECNHCTCKKFKPKTK